MHATIIELGETNAELRLLPDYQVADMLPTADYVTEITDEMEVADRLDTFISDLSDTECAIIAKYSHVGRIRTITFAEDATQAYFADRLSVLKERVADMSVDDFTDGMVVYELKNIIEDPLNYQVLIDAEVMSLDEFMRSLKYYKSVTFFIGSVYDYHY